LWDRGYREALFVTDREAAMIAARVFRGRKHLLLLNGDPTTPRGYRLLYRTARPFGHRDEQYWLYAQADEVNGR
jgi:hypothetical protein